MIRPLKILHLPVAFLPWTTGGREVFTYSLAVALQQKGVDNHVAFHQDPSREEPLGLYHISGLPVTVLPQIPDFNSPGSRYTRTFGQLPGFEEYVTALRPDAIHFHDQNGGASLSHLRVARKLGIKTVVTYHSPGQSCSQSELLFRAKTVCDGLLLVSRCTSCRLSVAGVPEWAADIIASMPFRAYSMLNGNSRISRMLSARTKTTLFINSFYEFMNTVDKIQVLTKWSEDLMILNSVDRKKLTLIRTAATKVPVPPVAHEYRPGHVLKVVFIGRCTSIKGIQVLIDAVKALDKDVPIKVSFFGPYWNDDFGKQMTARIDRDERFGQPEFVPNEQLQSRLLDMDVSVIPSTWLETGPLTFFDSQCAGLPVVGSNLGGLAELIQDSRNGLLFGAGDAQQLSEILKRLASEPNELNRLRSGIKGLRVSSDIAKEMMETYRSLVADPASA